MASTPSPGRVSVQRWRAVGFQLYSRNVPGAGWMQPTGADESAALPRRRCPLAVAQPARQKQGKIRTLGFLRTALMSSAAPPFRKAPMSSVESFPAETMMEFVSMSANTSLWRSNRPRWMYRYTE